MVRNVNKRHTGFGLGKGLILGFFFVLLLGSGLGMAQDSQGAPDQAWMLFLEHYESVSAEEQTRIREGLSADEQEYLDWLLTGRSNAETTPEPDAVVTVGVPAQLTYTVVARNLSGVPVENPVIRDNGRILNNDDAVKTGGNQDNVLEVGEVWTWTYHETVIGVSGEAIVNTATIEGPDDANRDTNLDNNTARTTIAVVEPPGSYDLAITKTVTATEVTQEIEIGEERDVTLDECDVWKAAQSGGYLGTEDTWDISTMPVGTVFDLRFNARSVPDRFVVEYPIGNRIHDTGWRGVQSYVDRNPQLYPGGLAGPGRGQEDGLFVKGQADAFKVIVYGPEENTVWSYEIRGNCPE